MKIGVISDSHGKLEYIDIAMEYLEDADLIIHAGDHYTDGEYIEENYNIEVVAVAGNCDVGGIDEKVIKIGGKTIFITHGHNYLVSINPNRLFYAAEESDADVVIFGHTHKPFYAVEEDIILINPGSVSELRANSERSFCIINIEDDEHNIEIDFVNI